MGDETDRPQVVVPEPVRRKAEQAGLQWWLDGLSGLVGSLVDEWALSLGNWYESGTEAVVVEADLADGTAAVLKVILPQAASASHEITALTLAEGRGCARMLRADLHRGAVLLERLGVNLASLDLAFERRQEVLADLASEVWRPIPALLVPSLGLPSGADKARSLRAFIDDYAKRVSGAVTAAALEHAYACTIAREAAHTDSRSALLHGDVHAWNALQRSENSFALVDPDGLFAEREYDLGVILREDPDEGDPYDRAAWLAERTGADAQAIFEWGVIERISTGLLLQSIGMDDVAQPMLRLANELALRTPRA